MSKNIVLNHCSYSPHISLLQGHTYWPWFATMVKQIPGRYHNFSGKSPTTTLFWEVKIIIWQHNKWTVVIFFSEKSSSVILKFTQLNNNCPETCQVNCIKWWIVMFWFRVDVNNNVSDTDTNIKQTLFSWLHKGY